MLTNFFGKSSPIHTLLCASFLLIGFFAAFFLNTDLDFGTGLLLKRLGILFVLFFSMLLVDFILRKNSLTHINSYTILIFVCLVVMVPAIFTDVNNISSNLFLLLALRRMASLTSERNLEKKLLDASLYITVAGLFNFWSLLFFAPLFWVLLRSTSKTFGHIFIPIVGLCTVLLLTIAYHLIVNDSLQWFITWFPEIQMDFAAYNTKRLLIPTAFMGTLLIWTMVTRILAVSSVQRKLQQNYILLVWVLGTAVAIGFLQPIHTGSELIFICAPLAIVTANYIEKASDMWFKETLLWLLLVLPILLLFL